LAEAMDQAEAGLSTAAASAQNAQEIDIATKAGRVRIHTARDYLANSTNYSRTCKIKGIKLFLAYTATTQAPDEKISTQATSAQSAAFQAAAQRCHYLNIL